MTTAIAILSLLGGFQGDKPQVTAELVTSVTAAQPGQPFLAAVILRIEPGWHVYWQNPGDSGTPTKVEWKLPAGWTASDLMWPMPSRFSEKALTTYGYEGSTMLVASITPPADARIGPVGFSAKASWLACKDVCVPGSLDLKRSLSITQKPLESKMWSDRLKAVQANVPRPLEDWKFEAEVVPGGFVLKVTPPKKLEESRFLPTFYASTEGTIEHSAPQQFIDREDGSFWIAMKKSQFLQNEPKRLKGILIAPKGTKWNEQIDAIIVDAEVKQKGE